MTNPTLVVSSLSRDFQTSRGASFRALNHVDLTIDRGETLALLGPNGAGKTTLIRIASTLLLPTSGDVSVDGFDVRTSEREVRARVGLVLGGDRGFYLRATVNENLDYFASLAKVPRAKRTATVNSCLEAVSLESRAQQKVETLSRGLKQRLHIARALLSDPPLLLLDEPTIGLDPEAAISLRSLVRQLRSDGRAVLLTTHYLFEAESLADSVAVLIGGQIIARGSVYDIANAGGVGMVTTFTLPHLPETWAAGLEATPGVRHVSSEEVSGRRHVVVAWAPGAEDEAEILRVIGAADTRLLTRPATLEEGYLALAGQYSRESHG